MATVDGAERPFTIEVDQREGLAVVTLAGACTMEVSPEIRNRLVPLVSDKFPALVIDMSRLSFIESTGLGGIVAAHLRARHHRGVIRLVNPSPAIREVLEITRLVQLFPVHATVEQAISATRTPT